MDTTGETTPDAIPGLIPDLRRKPLARYDAAEVARLLERIVPRCSQKNTVPVASAFNSSI